MTVIIIADREDLHADCIGSRVRESGSDVIRLSPVDDFNLPFRLTASSAGFLEIGGKVVEIDDVTGIYCRVAFERLAECFTPRNAVERYSIEEEAVAWLSALLMVPGSLWVNDPKFELWADVKPHSLMKASKIGLSVPEFVITNSLDLAASFSRGREVVIKPISDASFALQNGEYISVPDLSSFDAVGTSIFRCEEVNQDQIDSTPFLLQSYVKRSEEYRVTVIDDRTFVAKATLPVDTIDIKEAEFPIYIQSNIPAYENDLLVDLSKSLGLRLCTYDVLKSNDGQFFLVDINPGGNWLWLDHEFGGEISTSLAKTLACDLWR